MQTDINGDRHPCAYTIHGQGQALLARGSGQNGGHLAQPTWGQGPRHLTWPDLTRPGVNLA